MGVFLGVLRKKKLGLARFVRFVNAVQLINQLNFQPETLWLSPKSVDSTFRIPIRGFGVVLRGIFHENAGFCSYALFPSAAPKFNSIFCQESDGMVNKTENTFSPMVPENNYS